MPVSGKRGFGPWMRQQQKEIASKGGQAAHQKARPTSSDPEEVARRAARAVGPHEKGSAHEFSSRGAGRWPQGGEASSQDRNRWRHRPGGWSR